MVEGSLGGRIDDCIVSDSVAADLEGEEDGAIGHDGKKGMEQINKLLVSDGAEEAMLKDHNLSRDKS
jgi:hypothetical protein